MENYTIEFDTNQIIVKEAGTNVTMFRMFFPLDDVDNIFMWGNVDIRKKPFTDMKEFNWKSAHWRIMNLICAESEVYNCISSKLDDSGNQIIQLSTEFESRFICSIELKCVDKTIELIDAIHEMAVQNK